ncbi:MAG: SHOCT domain-containing protein [Streptomycetaceae bacterium]|nr:SHOCT domain-containing protein [Streptomycetaceae bacterium]
MNHPLLNVFLMIMWFFIWIMWLFLLFRIVFDVFRSHDMGGWAKALWILFLIVLPFLGVLVYLVVRGRGMSERTAQEIERREHVHREILKGTLGLGTTGELNQLAEMKNRGDLTQEEFERAKARILST